jgi:hypothetical protein
MVTAGPQVTRLNSLLSLINEGEDDLCVPRRQGHGYPGISKQFRISFICICGWSLEYLKPFSVIKYFTRSPRGLWCGLECPMSGIDDKKMQVWERRG